MYYIMNRYTRPVFRFFERATLLVERALGQDSDNKDHGKRWHIICISCIRCINAISNHTIHEHPWRLIVFHPIYHP